MELIVKQNITHAYTKEKNGLFAFIRNRTSSIEEAEDILQEVFESAILRANVTEPIENFTSWLYTIARNRLIDWYRKKKLKTISMQEEAGHSDDESKTIEDLIDDAGIDIEKDFIKDIISDELVREIDNLPAEQKFVIVHQAIEGKTFRELSEITGVPINTLLARKRYAIEALRSRLTAIKELINETR
jgi:RNA polymerase sigma factor (sigma-70 family)